jgi:hypothetical protein
LRADGDESVDVLSDGNQHLSGHVSTLLRAGSLIFNVNTSGTFLNEEPGELHHRSKTSVASVGIGNDGAEIVDIGLRSTFSHGSRKTLFALFSVVEKLCLEEMLYFVGHGVLGDDISAKIIL